MRKLILLSVVVVIGSIIAVILINNEIAKTEAINKKKAMELRIMEYRVKQAKEKRAKEIQDYINGQKAKQKQVIKKYTVRCRQYSNGENDPDTNCEGKKLNEHDLACNFLPLYTKVRIKGEIYVIRDRVNRKAKPDKKGLPIVEMYHKNRTARQLRAIDKSFGYYVEMEVVK